MIFRPFTIAARDALTLLSAFHGKCVAANGDDLAAATTNGIG
jgi:hypothetical protein